MAKRKFFVYNNEALVYIYDCQPDYCHILASHGKPEYLFKSRFPTPTNRVGLVAATRQDFDDFRIHFHPDYLNEEN